VSLRRAHDRIEPGSVHAAIGGYVKVAHIAPKPSVWPRFEPRYTPADVELLASVDHAHERLSGPATRHIRKREFEVYGKAEFKRLAKLSNGHLYSLHRSPRYGLRTYEKTRPMVVQIGERKKPAPNGQPGFLRIDTVHQGDGPGRGEEARESTTSTPSSSLRSGRSCWQLPAFQRLG